MSLRLTLTTPLRIVVDDPDVASLRAEDGSGDFGILPGHADFLTVIDAGVMRWRGTTGPWHFAALRGGVLTMAGGDDLRIAAREVILGDDLAGLQAQVAAARIAADDARRNARTDGARLQARAIRQMMRAMGAAGNLPGLEDRP